MRRLVLALAAAMPLASSPALAALIVVAGPSANGVDTNPATVATINAVGGGIVTDIDISVHITADHAEDWSLALEHLGTTVVLRPGYGFPPHIDGPFVVTFDDEAASAIGFNNSGTFQPTGLLSAFDGLPFAGAWNLQILDNYISGGGDNLVSWSIAANVVPEPASLALLGAGLAGLAAARRRKAA